MSPYISYYNIRSMCRSVWFGLTYTLRRDWDLFVINMQLWSLLFQICSERDYLSLVLTFELSSSNVSLQTIHLTSVAKSGILVSSHTDTTSTLLNFSDALKLVPPIFYLIVVEPLPGARYNCASIPRKEQCYNPFNNRDSRVCAGAAIRGRRTVQRCDISTECTTCAGGPYAYRSQHKSSEVHV